MNKIHVVIGVPDEGYLVHLAGILENGFKEYIDAHCFSMQEHFFSYLEKKEADVILVDERFGVDLKTLGTENCGYLCGSGEVKALGGFKAVDKYGRPDEIYAQIMELHAAGGLAAEEETEPEPAPGAPSCQTILVTGTGGGTGASTFGAAAASYSAMKGIQTFYLNLQALGGTGDFFQAQGEESLDDVLAALRAGHGDLADFAAEHAQIDGASGVSFFKDSRNPGRPGELTAQDWRELTGALRESGSYERLIVDCGFGLDERFRSVLEGADRIVLVADGRPGWEKRLSRAMEAFGLMEQQGYEGIRERLCVFYNCFEAREKRPWEEGLLVIGTMPPAEAETPEQVVKEMLLKPSFFERLFQV